MKWPLILPLLLIGCVWLGTPGKQSAVPDATAIAAGAAAAEEAGAAMKDVNKAIDDDIAAEFASVEVLEAKLTDISDEYSSRYNADMVVLITQTGFLSGHFKSKCGDDPRYCEIAQRYGAMRNTMTSLVRSNP